MKNFIKPGKSIEWLNNSGADVLSGGVVVMGNSIGIALLDIPQDQRGTVEIHGVYELPAASADAAPGERLFWDTETSNIVTVAETGTVHAGVSYAGTDPGDTKTLVLLTPFAASNLCGEVANISTADATDLASAIALANANKAKINALLGALRSGGVMDIS